MMTFLPALARLTTRLALWRVAEVGDGVQLRGHVYIHGGGHISLGRGVVLNGRAMPIELHVAPGAVLAIGDDTVLEPGTSIEAQERVDIGTRSHLRRLAKVMDNHFHPVGGDRHRRPRSKPVVLEAGRHVGHRKRSPRTRPPRPITSSVTTPAAPWPSVP
ncbi:MAG: acetyltransferase [Myxococcota bacterium]